MSLRGYRKVGFAVLVVLVVTLVLMTRFLQPEHYVSIMQSVIYGFLGANAIQHVGEKVIAKVQVTPKIETTTTVTPSQVKVETA